MPAAVAVATLMLLSLCGAAIAKGGLQWGLLVISLGSGTTLLVQQRRWRSQQALLLSLMLLLCALRGSHAAHIGPGPLDPVHHLAQAGELQQLEGRWQQDSSPKDGQCRGLVLVRRLDGQRVDGLTEVLLNPCSQALRAGALVETRGQLRKPSLSHHPLLPSPAQRLARHNSWSQFKTAELKVVGQRWSPLADARRRIEEQFRAVLGAEQGPVLAALVLGGAQVELPEELRQAFRVAGLSHALAASGFHLSVLLGSVLVVTRSWPRWGRLFAGIGAMLVFLALAGAQASVVRAVLMGLAGLLIQQSGGKSRPLGVLLATLVLMLWLHPAWARSIGFQFSAAATAGLVLTAPGLEARLKPHLPSKAQGLAGALAVPLAAMAWTLPLQWLHFGAMPLYALVANLLASPLLMALTLLSMGLALVVLLLPGGLVSLIAPLITLPMQALAFLLLRVVTAISHWPWAQVLTGRPQWWMVLVVVLTVVSCCTRTTRGRKAPVVLLPLSLLALGLHGAELMADAVVHVEQWGRQWVLLRHQGRAALISSSGDALSCRVARQLGHGSGHGRFDWVAVLDPVASDAHRCWTDQAHTLVAEPWGLNPLQRGQRLTSPGLELKPLTSQGRHFALQAGQRRVRLQRHGLRLSATGGPGAGS
ncbi:ComEC/Rec2 family competence protein [Synechococcus sp. RS9916]|uniref:ComEC/Rec2 family competence protein n=1 Tax=Synechococcus sp. RS9916 TaxID=221359 RepID=UPI0000E538A3|nr:ComEC/Rec2 family competence protein [Synechococcus sp. RS9916]EAU74381.1 ComEC/Rec2-related protein [Synechococcus sp. RS9916]